MPPEDIGLSARRKSARDAAVRALNGQWDMDATAALLAEYVALLVLAGRQDLASEWMPLAQF